MSGLDEMIGLGFEPVTEWVMKGDRIAPRSSDWSDHGGWLYAFVIAGEVKYIGLTTRVLRSRIRYYSHIKNSQTNHLRELVSEALSRGARVDIYGLRQHDEAVLVAEEARLRALYPPPWNRV